MNRCDCHIHIISLSAQYPLAPSRDYTPPEATADAYRVLAGHLNLDRAVVIQPSVYGTDNSCTRDALLAANGRWRGIAVIRPDAKEAEIRSLHEAGFRGVRFNLLHAHQDDLECLESVARLIAPFNWHIEFAIRSDQLCEIADRLAALPVHVVVDHMARLPPNVTAADPMLKQVLELLKSGQLWIKLAGAYIVSKTGRPYDDLSALAQTLVNARPDRMVWGSNWPHPRRDLSTAENLELVQLVERWGFDPEVRDAIFIYNPARLYDF